MTNIIRGKQISHVDLQYRVAFYHNLSPDQMDQTISIELMKKQDKRTAEKIYGALLSAVYVDHAYNGEVMSERPGFEKLLEDARAGKHTPKALLALPETENSDIDELSYAYWLGYIYRCECIMHDESSRMVYSAFTEDIMRKAYTDVVNSPMNDRNLSDCAKDICAELDRLLVEEIWPQRKHRKYM